MCGRSPSKFHVQAHSHGVYTLLTMGAQPFGFTATTLNQQCSSASTVRQVYSVLRRERSSPETRQATDAGAHAFPARRQRARTRSVATSHTQESAACDGRPSRRTEDAARAV